jgi:hypothetical protein
MRWIGGSEDVGRSVDIGGGRDSREAVSGMESFLGAGGDIRGDI